ARVDDEAGAVETRMALAVGGCDGRRVGRRYDVDLGDPHSLAHLGAEASRVAQQKVIEFTADHLERQAALVLDHVVEAPDGRGDPLAIDEANTGLADESRTHVLEHAQLLEEDVTERQE